MTRFDTLGLGDNRAGLERDLSALRETEDAERLKVGKPRMSFGVGSERRSARQLVELSEKEGVTL
jgi:hypothetical protein